MIKKQEFYYSNMMVLWSISNHVLDFNYEKNNFEGSQKQKNSPEIVETCPNF